MEKRDRSFGLRNDATEFPMMVVISLLYRCNLGCPNCPYTSGNSAIRTFYRERDGEYLPVELWNAMAKEAGPYNAWLRCTGGGEPMLHPHMVDMIEFAKTVKARVWLNTNGSCFGPGPRGREKLERIIAAGVDLIEFSMDAGDPVTYDIVRPPLGGRAANPLKRWEDQVASVRAALDLRKRHASATRVVVSIIRQDVVEAGLEQAKEFWLGRVGVDEVITRKFLTWDSNTSLSLDSALDPQLYAELPAERKEPCVWFFERLNVDTLGRIALCGQDISFRTADQFPTLHEKSLKEIWQGEAFNWYRRMHLAGTGAKCNPCRECSAWFAGVRDWDYGWLRVLATTGHAVVGRDLGAEVELFQPRGDVVSPGDDEPRN